jgi:histidinol phosphatase-like PHP family hydrolase
MNVFLEITTRRGHAYTNGLVASRAKNAGAKMIINTDSHSPADLVTRAEAEKVAQGAGLSDEEIKQCFLNSEIIVNKVLKLS